MRHFILFLSLLSLFSLYCQEKPAAIITAVPFLSITPDATSAGMADIGVASRPDVYSMAHNSAKYAFVTQKSAIGISYTPWLGNITGDIFLSYANYYHRLPTNGTLATSLRIFSLGEIEMTDYQGGQIIPLGSYHPFELSIDIAYSMKLSTRLSMGIALRYTRSDISSRNDPLTDDFHAGRAFSADLSLYYISRKYRLKKMGLSFSWGINIRDIGSRIDYGDSPITSYDYLPTTLSLGGGLHLHHTEKNTFSFLIETSKLLVPTPVWNEAENAYTVPDTGLFEGIWSALTRAPGGAREKLSEYTLQCATEWTYDNRYALRAGWYYSDPHKEGIQNITLGASATYKKICASVSYAIPLYEHSSSGSSMRISLCFYLGKDK